MLAASGITSLYPPSRSGSSGSTREFEMFVPYAPGWTIATSTPRGASSYDDASASASRVP
jgi:hypothetical protein